ncbi:MAG: hypothetical protein JW829_09435 [Pirellulales bacterium]|nr:hypothetical protein [Pirellulales bacterium]
MPNEDQFPQELIDLERSLAGLEPAPSRINRDRLMFAAGVASGIERVGTEDDSGHKKRAILAALQRSLRSRSQGLSTYRIPSWPIATAASLLIACLFAVLYAIESNRGPVTVREVVYVDRPISAPDSVMASHHHTPDSKTMTGDFESNLQYSVLLQPVFPFGAWKPQLPSYIALRQLAITQGIDALPQREYTGETGPQTSPRTAFELLKEFLPSRSSGLKTSDKPLLPESIYNQLGDTI